MEIMGGYFPDIACFASLLRLRIELTNLIIRHSNLLPDSVAKATKQSSLYEGLLQGLNVGGWYEACCDISKFETGPIERNTILCPPKIAEGTSLLGGEGGGGSA